MKIELTAEELAALVMALQERQKSSCEDLAKDIKNALILHQTGESQIWK